MKKIFSISLLIILMLCSKEFIFAEKITILYTGETLASLYPCHCPKAPHGGLARRATLIKKLRKENPNLLILDAGNFFAGGVYDTNRVNVDLDKKRTEINFKAMQMMNYDVVGVGVDEFNFGKDFLENTINKTKINFVSSNIDLKGTHPFLIKEMNGVKIGILSVMPQAKQLESVLNIAEPIISLKDNIKKLKDANVDLIILLSQLGSKEDERLIAEEVLDVDIVITGAPPTRKDIITKINSKIFLRAVYEARSLGKLQFEFEDGKIDDATLVADEIALGEDISDDKEVSLILPKCVSDNDCRKPGFRGRCENPATDKSQCRFSEYAKIPLLIIEPSICYSCDTKRALFMLKELFPGIKPSYLKSNTKEAQDLIKKFDIKMLPAYLLDKSAGNDNQFLQQVKQGLAELRNDKYFINPSFVGVSYFVARDYINNRIDMFIDLNNKNSKQVLATIKQILEEMQTKTDFNLHFLALEKPNGEFYNIYNKEDPSLIEEYKLGVCIMKYYPNKWLDYVLCRVNQTENNQWQDCLSNEDKIKELIKECFQSDEGTKLLKENIRLNRELRILYGPLLLLNNQEVFGFTEKTPILELRRIINLKNKGDKLQ